MDSCHCSTGGGTTTTWGSTDGGTGVEFDYNDPNDSGCTDGDGDGVAGSLTIDPSIAGGATLATGTCAACSTDYISLGNEATFNGTAVESITLITANASSSDIGDWVVEGIDLTQKIPGEQEAYDDYEMEMTLTASVS